jgi:hypothetical protein
MGTKTTGYYYESVRDLIVDITDNPEKFHQIEPKPESFWKNEKGEKVYLINTGTFYKNRLAQSEFAWIIVHQEEIDDYKVELLDNWRYEHYTSFDYTKFA